MPDSQKFYSCGKLLITGEYVVLEGALAFALPTKYGQDLVFSPDKNNILKWESFSKNKKWFSCEIIIDNILKSKDKKPITKRLLKILQTAKNINPQFLKSGGTVKTHLEFEKNWGLGSSATLIHNIALWAKINPFELLKLSFGGSGYDVACAKNKTPLHYQIINQKPISKKLIFSPNFKNHLYFIFLNQKKNSSQAIKEYQKIPLSKRQKTSEKITQMSQKIVKTTSLSSFQELLEHHENIIANLLEIPPIQKRLFFDYQGIVKSLGAWGGDFVLAAGDENTTNYFKNKGYKTVIPYSKMIL